MQVDLPLEWAHVLPGMRIGTHEFEFPIYLAPMAGVTDTVFRRICKEFGADVMVTEFVSSDGIMHRNRRTSEYLAFDPVERPLGVQLFGADPAALAEAARKVVDWVEPDFIDLNFGCPVNKVVCKNGGSALLKDCPLLQRVAEEVVRAVAPVPVTAKIRIGWDENSINARETARILEGAGIQVLAVHGRTKSQGYSGEANWRVIGEVVQSVRIPVIGNGDLTSAQEVLRRRQETGVAGVMLGRSAMAHPWIFSEIKSALKSGEIPPPPELPVRWALIRRHCAEAVERRGDERSAMASLRARLMAYSKGMPECKWLRVAFSQVASLGELDGIAEQHLSLPAVIEHHTLTTAAV